VVGSTIGASSPRNFRSVTGLDHLLLEGVEPGTDDD
jgi:hypothetical protein